MVAGLGLAAAIPSLVWGLKGSGFIHDDWSIASRIEFLGLWDTLVDSGTRVSARPLSALYFEVTHTLFGTHPLPHVLVLAALNAAAAALLFIVGTRLGGGRLALWTTVVWVALPNRGSTRLWITMAPAVLALCLLLFGVLLLVADRPLAGGVALTAAMLLYESVAAVAVAVLAVWAWRSRHHARALHRAVAPLGLVLASGAITYARSPKRELDTAPFSNATNVVAAQFGRGVFGAAARVGALVILAALTVAIARALLPSFRAALSAVDRAVLAGAGLVLLGSAPFFVAGFPFATDGIFDRGNLVAGLGTALMLGAITGWLAGLAGGAGLVVAAGVLGYVAALNAVDLRDYREAVRDGGHLLARLDADLPDPGAPVVVGPPLPNRGGVAQFIAYHDLGAALRLRRDDPHIRARIAVSDADFATSKEPIRYDWVMRTLSGPDR